MSREGENDDDDDSRTSSAVSPYDEAMEALSSLITKRSRADSSNQGHGFSLMFDYLKILELEEPVSRMKVIHVAGTKGKGSTCAFTESILRNCGFHTGLFISPHLIDVRERFRLDGSDICEKKFLAYFWWCWDRLKEKTSGNIPMPTYFRFLALLAFKMFSAEQVDVVILEVGLGGKFDATNVVHKPVVCGIASLGYDHMEILGNTLGEIAGEKAGIFKQGIPAFTVPQPDEAMRVLEEKASNLDVHLQVARPLDANLLNGLHLGLDGEHQYYNAGLAIALCSTWLQQTGHTGNYLDQTTSLSPQFLSGLTMATLQGRGQIVADQYIDNERRGDLVFYLDGAHSPESMEVCAEWFCRAIRGDDGKHNLAKYQNGASIALNKLVDSNETPRRNSTQILLFNCMSVRDPQLLLPRLMHGCSNNGVQFKKAIFVPNISVHDKVWSSSLPPDDFRAHLSWQRSVQKVWQTLIDREKGVDARNTDRFCGEIEEGKERNYRRHENSTVFPSLPLAIKWLRDSVQQNKSVRFQVLVTGSLHLVGDVLRLIKK